MIFRTIERNKLREYFSVLRSKPVNSLDYSIAHREIISRIYVDFTQNRNQNGQS